MKSSPRSESALAAHSRRRILAAFGEASAADLAAGLAWYDRAAEGARALCPDNPSRAAGVIAALSPRTLWSVNLTWAAAVIEAADSGAECPRVHTTAMRAQAWRIARGEHPLDVLRGPKVRAFYANIMGDLNAVTVDVWAAMVAEGKRDDRGLGGRRYARIAQAYRDAAALLDLPPRDVQAAVWVHVRGSAD